MASRSHRDRPRTSTRGTNVVAPGLIGRLCIAVADEAHPRNDPQQLRSRRPRGRVIARLLIGRCHEHADRNAPAALRRFASRNQPRFSSRSRRCPRPERVGRRAARGEGIRRTISASRVLNSSFELGQTREELGLVDRHRAARRPRAAAPGPATTRVVFANGT